MNTEQTAVVNSDASKIVCVAGPGSGKSSVLVARIVRLIEAGEDSGGMVVITFTNQAAEVLKERISKQIDRENEKLREDGCLVDSVSPPLGYCGTLHGYCLRLLRQHGHLIGMPKNVTVVTAEIKDDLLAEAVAAHRYRGTAKELAAEVERNPLAQRAASTPAQLCAATFHRLMIRNGFVDYDGILSYGLAVVDACRKKGHVFEIGHLFVDEMQDSSQMDADIYDALPAKNKFVVGDPRQSIYAFRGGSPKHLDRLARLGTWCNYDLFLNYRCGVDICRAANKLIDHNPGRIEKNSVAAKDEFGTIEVKWFNDEAKELAAIYSAVMAATGTGESVAVLCRFNLLVDKVTAYLRAHGVQVRSRTARKVPEGFSEMLECFTFMANPDNDFLAYRNLVKTAGKKEADAIKAEAGKKLQSINATYSNVPEFTQLDMLPVRLGMLGTQIGLIEAVRKIVAAAPLGATLADVILQLQVWATSSEEDGEGVDVRTIHGAKGCEWDTVILPGWEQGTFPSAKSDEDLQDQRRLAFVALTRARRTVKIMGAREVFDYGRKYAHEPSQFIGEAGLNL